MHVGIILSIIGTFFGENYASIIGIFITIMRIIGEFGNTGQYES